MRISTILDHIDNRSIALPEFQRGYVWNRDQVRGLMDSLYRRHPIGSLLVWATDSEDAQYRGEGGVAPGVVKLLLDGQQRMTTLYGIIRGAQPAFFDGRPETFTGLYFNVETEEFRFYQPRRMENDPLWINVTELMKDGIGPPLMRLGGAAEFSDRQITFVNRLNGVNSIQTVEMHVEEVTGADKTIDVVVDIFNRVNSGGTKLSKGDLALAKICAEWSDARDTMKASIERWRKAGYQFELDWLLRNVNAVLNGEANFGALHAISAGTFQDSLDQTVRIIDRLLAMIDGRLGLDHDRVLFGRYAFPVMARYMSCRGGKSLDAEERDALLFWYVQSAIWGRFSGSTETVINRDLACIEGDEGDLERLIETVAVERGNLLVRPEHFQSWSVGARFYPMLYLLTRTSEARDFGMGLPLRKSTLGRHSRLEVHHIFPKSLLYKEGHTRSQANALANFCFLTQETNLAISNRSPEEYLVEVDARHPGALESQWVPMERDLWKLERYPSFLEARRSLLAEAANSLLDGLHAQALQRGATYVPESAAETQIPTVPGGVTDDAEEQALTDFRAWMKARGLPEGEYEYELTDLESGTPLAILDLAWPNGIQERLSEAVCLLLEEESQTIAIASRAGFRCFTDVPAFTGYVSEEVLGNGVEE